MAKVAFIGLGVMGYPMAGHLATKGGHDVTVYNRTAAKAEKWAAEFGGSFKTTPREAAEGAEIVFSCVGNDDDLRSVMLGDDGVLAGMTGGVIVDNTTASAEVARELHAAAKAKGIGFVDAPVSGGQAGAENGVLTVMCGGDEGDYAKAEPAIMSFARASRLMGASGAGQLTKMVNQICIAGLLQGLSEGVNFGKKAGLDMEAVIDVISKGRGPGSWQMENRAGTMAKGEFDFGFAVDWMRKDLSICLGEAKNNGARLPVTALVDQFYAQVQGRGGNRWDTSSLIHLLMND